MSYFFQLMLVICLTSHATAVRAGTDSSGGGEFIEDRDNPWFLPNTPFVSYCLDLDKDAFTQSEETLAQLIHRALLFWKEELARAQRSGYSIRLGTQEWQLHRPCQASTDIAFQFGKRQASQESFLPDPQKFIGVAVRTAYDTKTLRGHGFVYISPDHGPLRFRGEGLRPHAWDDENGMRLYHLIVHEIGHIFGMPHMGESDAVMGAAFAESLVKANDEHHVRSFSRLPPDVLTFNRSKPRQACGYSRWDLRDGLDYLGITADCLKFVFHDNAGFELLQAASSQGPWESVGSFSPKIFSSRPSPQSSHVTLFLTDENQLRPLPKGNRERMGLISPGIKRETGFYRLHASGKELSLSLETSPNLILLDGVKGGMIAPQIFQLWAP